MYTRMFPGLIRLGYLVGLVGRQALSKRTGSELAERIRTSRPKDLNGNEQGSERPRTVHCGTERGRGWEDHDMRP